MLEEGYRFVNTPDGWQIHQPYMGLWWKPIEQQLGYDHCPLLFNTKQEAEEWLAIELGAPAFKTKDRV